MRGMRRAFSLAEVCLALGIAVFALVAIFGLLPVGIGSNHASLRQTEAVNLVSGIVEDLRQTAPGTSGVSSRYGISMNQKASEFFVNRAGEPVSAEQSHYKVNVTLTPPPPGRIAATSGSVEVSWPPAAKQPSHVLAAFVALDRNGP